MRRFPAMRIEDTDEARYVRSRLCFGGRDKRGEHGIEQRESERYTRAAKKSTPGNVLLTDDHDLFLRPTWQPGSPSVLRLCDSSGTQGFEQFPAPSRRTGSFSF